MNAIATTPVSAYADQIFSMQRFDAKLFDLIVQHATAEQPNQELVIAALTELQAKKRGGYILSTETSELLTLLEAKAASFVH